MAECWMTIGTFEDGRLCTLIFSGRTLVWLQLDAIPRIPSWTLTVDV